MLEKKINFSSTKSFFESVDNYLKKGFIIKDSPFCCLRLEKDNECIILELDNYKQYKNLDYIIPNYKDTQLNIIEGFRYNYGIKNKRDIDLNIFNKKYKHTIILILDGLGMNILNNFNKYYPNNFLYKHFFKTTNSIYPSTTAASTTSIKTGLTPLETGWTGWQNYIREINQNVILFTGTNYYTGEQTKLKGFDILKYKYYFSDLNICGAVIEPEFNNPNYTFKNTLDRTLEAIYNGIDTLYVYDESPDRELHELGTLDKSIYDKLNDYSILIEDFYNKLPNDTLLIITADHGHTDTIDFNMFYDMHLYSMLNRLPSNDTRCVTFSVKDEYMEEFSRYFNSVYGKIYKLLDSKEAIKLGYFGDTNNINERIEDFLADFIAIAYSNVYLTSFIGACGKKSAHAGISKDEMIVPIMVCKK